MIDDGPNGRRLASAYAALFSAQLAIGAAAIFARFALVAAGPLAVSALRLAIAAVPVVIIARMRARSAARNRRTEWLLAAAGAVLAVHFATWIGSLGYTSVAIATLLVCTTPLWTGLYETLVLGRRRSPRFWLALALAAVGLVLIVGGRGGGGAGTAPATAAFGDVLAWLGSIAIGVYFVIVRRVGTATSAYSTVAIVSRTYTWAALFLIAGALAAHQLPPPPAATGAWAGILAMALVSQLFGHTALNYALRSVSASTVATVTLLEPIFAALLAAAIFGESISGAAVAGAIAVLIAIALVLREERT